MKKILNYIRNGKGLALKLLLPFSFIVVVFLAVIIKISGDNIFIPAAQEVADEFLPVRIENGAIVEPADTVKTYSVVIGSEDDPDAESMDIVMDTKVDYLNTTDLKQGVYITRRAIYTVQGNQTRIHNFEDSLYLPKEDYHDFFKSVLNWSILFVVVLGFIAMSLFYFITTIFYAFCSYVISALLGKEFNFDLRMRLSAVAFIATYIVFSVLGWLGFSSYLIFFLAVLALQWVILKEIPGDEPQKPAENS